MRKRLRRRQLIRRRVVVATPTITWKQETDTRNTTNSSCRRRRVVCRFNSIKSVYLVVACRMFYLNNKRHVLEVPLTRFLFSRRLCSGSCSLVCAPAAGWPLSAAGSRALTLFGASCAFRRRRRRQVDSRRVARTRVDSSRDEQSKHKCAR